MLIHLIYSSVPVVAYSVAELEELIMGSRRNNARDDVSGMLLYADGSFFQVLEGPERAVDALYERLTHDPRHHALTVIIREPIVKRAFTDWTMGFANVRDPEFDHIDGLSDFFDTHWRLNPLDAGRSRKLLTAFAGGRWRPRSGRADAQTHRQLDLVKRAG